MHTDKKNRIAAVISYLGWPLWIVAFIIRDKGDGLSRHHLNQGFVLAVAQTVVGILTRFHGLFGLAGRLMGMAVLVLTVMGIISAVRASYEPLPVIGDVKLI